MAEHKIELETGGSVWKVLVKPGDTVEAEQELFILEVMKMEVPYSAPTAGTITALEIAEGDVVEEGQIAATLDAST
ncbi:MAG: acetyl-CoA carboxylase biotin carboxyl carrier protein subunit [Pseudomonadota bacterium]